MAVEPSILKSIKKLLGLADDYLVFDPDIIMFINSSFSSLHQLGVGTVAPIFIEDDTKSWADLGISEEAEVLVKIYIYLKVRMLFDPPATSFLIEAVEKQLSEQEFRLLVFHDESAEATYADDLEGSDV